MSFSMKVFPELIYRKSMKMNDKAKKNIPRFCSAENAATLKYCNQMHNNSLQ